MPPFPRPAVRVYAYSGCDTCRKALKFLTARNVAHEVLAIRETPPSIPELRRMLDFVGGDLRRLFNTSGQDYRALGIADRLPTLQVDEALARLAGNGNLVKRPFLLTPDTGRLGFRLEEWETLFPPKS
jgi:arsenate reductase